MNKEVTKESMDVAEYNLWKHNELLSHKVPYILQKEKKGHGKLPDSYTIFDEDGVERKYKPLQVQGVHRGLVCYVFIPLDADNTRVHVAFRGTHNRVSAQRNLKANAPGSVSFSANRHKIIDTIEKVIQVVDQMKTTDAKVRLTIGGHSLGGADTQNCATEILKEMSLKPDGILAQAVGTLNIIHKNAPGVSAKTKAVAKASVEAIKHNKKTAGIELNYYPILVAGDVVQSGGYTSILSDIPPEQVNTRMLRINIDKDIRLTMYALLFEGPITAIKRVFRNMYQLHKIKIFNPTAGKSVDVDAKVTMEVFSNSVPEHRAVIDQDLTNKTLQNLYKGVTSIPKKIANAFANQNSKANIHPVTPGEGVGAPKISKKD